MTEVAWTAEAFQRLKELSAKAHESMLEEDYLGADETGLAHIYRYQYVDPSKPACFISDAEVDEYYELALAQYAAELRAQMGEIS